MYNTHIALTLCLFILGIFGQVPTSVPFLGNGGTVPAPAASSLSFGQLITKVSDIQTFKFWGIGLAGGQTATLNVALWNSVTKTAGASIKSITVSLIDNINYASYTVSVNVDGLDPLATYAVFISLPLQTYRGLQIATKPTTGGVVGGLIKKISTIWNYNYPENLVFEIVTKSILKLQYNSFSEGDNFDCQATITYTAIQVNWYTNLVNNNYTEFATRVGGPCPNNAPLTPFGVANTCGRYDANGVVDLRGTQYKVAANQFSHGGWDSGGSATYTNNDQTVTLSGGGWCGWVAPTAAIVALGNDAPIYGGYYIQLERV